MAIVSSNSLFHFTGTQKAFFGILQKGFRHSYCFEEYKKEIAKFIFRPEIELMRIKGSSETQYGIAVPMICFCDIPLLQTSIHRKKYGNYCIGLDKEMAIKIPKGKLTVVSGVSGSGKTTLLLESMYPAIKSYINGEDLPDNVIDLECEDIKKIELIDSVPIGKNVRSTVATYSKVLDDLRREFAKLSDEYKMSDFSYNTGKLRCETCNGTGNVSMDVQFLPDVE